MSTWDDFSGCEHVWNELLEASAARSIFLTWEWVQSWWKCFSRGRELMVLTCLNTAGELLAIAPLMRTHEHIAPGISGRVVRLIGDSIGGSENLDWIIRAGYESSAVCAFLEWLDQNPSEWDVLELNTMPNDSPVASAIRKQIATRLWRLVEHESRGYLLPLPNHWEILRASLSKNMRSQITSRLRRLESRFDVRLWRCERFEDVPHCLEKLFSLHNKRWRLRGVKGSFFLEEKQHFYGEMAAELLRRGWLSFWLLDLNGRTVAAEFGLVYDGTYSFLQAGFDPDYSSYSVGLILRVLIMRELIRKGIRSYDFLGGEDEHKQRWVAQKLTYLHVAFARPHTSGAMGLTLADTTAKSKSWLRARVPRMLWSAVGKSYRLLRHTELGHGQKDGQPE